MQGAVERDLAEIVSAVGRADRPRATALAVEAHANGLDHPLVLLLVAEHREAQGRLDAALDLLRQASEAAPDAAEVWRRYGGLLVRQGRLKEGLAALDEALDMDPDLYTALIDAGSASYLLAELTAAEGYYRNALALRPDQTEALAGLAAIAARREDFAAARDLAARVLAKDTTSYTAHLVLARADFHQGAADLAEARIGTLLARADLPDDLRAGAFDLRADARDALDRTADAFADYADRNAILQRLNAPRMAAEIRERRVDRTRRVTDYLAAAPATAWSSPADRDPRAPTATRRHVFLAGFPRSGTTLLEKALAGHPDIVTLEEVDHLEAVAGRFLDDAVALERLSKLSSPEAETLRAAYWRAVSDTVGHDISGRIVVDKLPLHSANLPLIAKVFPDARVIFALRDPRDVVFSCFRRLFRINAAMFEFLTLEGAARYYDAVMTLADLCRKRMALNITEVRHESVVADFDGEVRRILDFIGAEWNPGVRDFAARARAALKTPSDPQVARGLNAAGVGQWRRYQAQLEPALGVLALWARRWGYPSD